MTTTSPPAPRWSTLRTSILVVLSETSKKGMWTQKTAVLCALWTILLATKFSPIDHMSSTVFAYRHCDPAAMIGLGATFDGQKPHILTLVKTTMSMSWRQRQLPTRARQLPALPPRSAPLPDLGHPTKANVCFFCCSTSVGSVLGPTCRSIVSCQKSPSDDSKPLPLKHGI